MEDFRCPNCCSSDVTKTMAGNITASAKEVGKIASVVGGKVIENNVGIPFLGKGVSAVGKWGLSFIPLEFVCNSCDSIFQVTFDTENKLREIALKKLPMPEGIIQNIREAYIENTRKNRPFISAIIFSLLTIYCAVYFFIGLGNDSWFEGAGQIVLGFVFGIIFFIPSVYKWNRIMVLNKEIINCEHQSLREFKHSHRELFSQYKQYN